MKILLVHPPADEEYGIGNRREAQYLSAPPIGLMILASVIEKNIPEVEIEIIDGNLIKMPNIISKINTFNADLVGISSWYSKHRNTLLVCQKAKEVNPLCITVIGGPNASHLGQQILQNNDFVDFVVKGDGEESFLSLCKKENEDIIPNLYYKIGNKVQFTYSQKSKLNNLFSCKHIDVAEYMYDGNKPFPISLIRGCIKAVKHGRCSFCSLPTKGISVMPPKLAWKQIGKLKKYGPTYFFETGDSFIPGYYQKLIDTRPENLQDVQFRIYASPDQITKASIKILTELNVKEVFLGIESTSDLILKKIGKLYSKENIINALALLDEANIRVQVPFIYGLPGETITTAQESFDFAKGIISKFPNIYSILTSVPVPLVGSKLFRLIAGEAKSDLIDYEKLTRRLIEEQTSCSFNEVQNFVKYTSKLIGDANRSGGMCLTK